MREPVDVLGVEPHALEQVAHAVLRLAPRHAVQAQRRADDLADALARVQRRDRVLEDELDLAAHRLSCLRPRCVMSRPRKRSAPVGGLEQPHDAARQGALAAARLAHHAQRLALVEAQRDVVDGMHVADRAVDEHALLDREVELDVLGLQQRHVALGLGRAPGLGRCGGASALTPPPIRGRARCGRPRPHGACASARRRASIGRDARGRRSRATRAAAPPRTCRMRAGSAGRKWQPCGALTSDGGWPGIAGRRWGGSRSMRVTEPSRPQV